MLSGDEAKVPDRVQSTFLLETLIGKDCQGSFEQADLRDIGVTRTGLGFTPSLAHVEQACTETINVRFTRLQPRSSAAGKAGMARR